ncbi:MAG: glycoside hydrolase family 3 C-terminal domain-containing protein [Clostridiales bacterium]|nr:glycoside hydrolase family 3 C-terminal domain-containing protein [Clostridiales bacterium]
MISVSCGGNNMAAGTQIVIEIDGAPVVIPLAEIPSPALSDVAIERSLQPGAHTIAVSAVLVPGVGGMESLAIDSLSLTEYMAVASPAFSLPSGSYTRATALSITLPSEWKNAKIRYTADGSEPSATAGTEYAGVLNIFPAGAEVGATITYKAVAYQDGKAPSAVAAAEYTAAEDSASLGEVACNRASGALTNTSMVGITLTHAITGSGGAIWYTVDGSEPSPTNPAAKKYVSGIKILTASTLKAKAFDTAGNSSPTLERAYTLTASVPTALHLPTGGTTVGKGSAIALTSATNVSPYMKIWYTSNGADPVPEQAGDGETFLYAGPIEVPWDLEHGAQFSIRAIAGGDGIGNSAAASFSYTFDANTPRLTEIKRDPGFIAWKAGGFKNGEEPQSLIDLADRIFDAAPRNTTANQGIYNVFGGGGNQGNGVPGSAWRTTGLQAYGIPDLHSYDGPAGARLSAESGAAYERNVTYWPNGSARASAWNKELSYEQGAGWGKELNYFSLNVILAPGVNIHRSVLNGRNFEYYSEDPMLAGLTAAAEISGVQKDGQAGVSLKHYAMNQQETNRTNGITRASTRAIREIYLRTFQYAVEEAQPWTIMTAFNDINGIHASQNWDLLNTIPRDEWGYEGVFMTDYNGYGTAGNGNANTPNNMYPYYSEGIAPTTHAGLVKAGNTFALASGNANNVRASVESGFITQEEFRREFRKLCVYASKHNTFNSVPWHFYTDPEIKASNSATAMQLAEESAVLLKNGSVGGSAALPLNKAASGKILSLGMGASRLYRGGTGSGSINMTAEAAARLTQLPEALRSVVGYDKVINTASAAEFPRADGLSEVSSITASGAMSSTGARTDLQFTDERFGQFYSDSLSAVVYVIQRESGEGADIRVQKGAYYLSDAETRLIDQGSALANAKGIPFVVVFNTGSWVEMESWKDKADAIIQCWNTGEAAATPIANLLFGDANPSGKLPTTVPIDVVGKDANGNFLSPSEGEFALSNSAGNGGTYREGIFVGYRYYDSFKVPASYPFGFGLSYTSFEFSNPQLSKTAFGGAADTVTASVTIRNAGSRAGKEVAQFYIGAPGVSMVKPVKELKGYEKTSELAPGESQTLSVEFNAMSLASYDELRGLWVVEPGEHTVYFSNSSAAEGIKHALTLTVEEEIIAFVAHKEALAPNLYVTANSGASAQRDSDRLATFYEYSPNGLSLQARVYRTRAADGNVALDYLFTVVNKSESGNVGDEGILLLAEYDGDGKLLGYVNQSFVGQKQTLTETSNAASSRNFISYDFRMSETAIHAGTAKIKAFLWADGTYIPMNGGAFINLGG